jgi:outer membrane receptor protein involved in Fe transport
LTLTNTTTFSDTSVQRRAPVGTGNADINTEDLTNELVLAFDDAAGFSAITGLYLSDFDSDESLNLAAFGLGTGDFTDKRNSLGIFAESTISISENTYLTVGGRYQRDSQDRDGGFAPFIPIDFDNTFDAFLPKFELAHDLSDDLRIGLLIERGFNAGGFTFNFDTFATETFDEETLWNYEVFLRGTFLDNRLSLNANVFYSDISDVQIATLVELGPDFFANVFSNADDARTIGAELEARFSVNEQFSVQGGIGISDTQYQSNSSAGALIDGNEFQRTPGLTAVGGFIWEPVDNLSLSAFGRYSDGYFSDDANLAVNETDSYFTGDVQVSYTFGNARVYLDVTNVFDALYEVAIFDGGTLASVGAPRQASIGLELSF